MSNTHTHTHLASKEKFSSRHWCKEPNFLVDGRAVRRRVLAAPVAAKGADLTRAYSNLDADHCLGAGLRLQDAEGVFLDYWSFNRKMRRKTYECSKGGTINYDSETNNAFQALRRCHQTLQQRVGWTLAADGEVNVLLSAAAMLCGFYTSFAEAGTAFTAAGGSFVANLTSWQWSQSAWRGHNHNSMCFLRRDLTKVANPYLEGAFDAARGYECERSACDVWTVDSRCSLECQARAPGWQASSGA